MNNKLKEFEEFYWTIHYSKCIIKLWEIETPSGRNGDKLLRSSRKNRFKKVWS
jgi:hypothetical protein